MPGLNATPVEEKSGMQCIHCGYLLKNPVQTDDGIRLCKDCCSEIQSMPGPCSTCGIAIDKDSNAFPDRAVARELARLLVFCVYKHLGCGWVGPVKEWEDHCGRCDYKGVECPHKGCKEIVEKGKLEEHRLICQYRLDNCEYCGLNMVFAKIKQHLEESCDEYPVSCDAEGCNVKLPRKELRDHKLKYCIIEECLICHKKVYRKTGKEVPKRSAKARVATDGDAHTTSNSSEPAPDPTSKSVQSEQSHSCVGTGTNEPSQASPTPKKKRSRGRVVADGDANDNEPSESVSTYRAKSRGRVVADGDANDNEPSESVSTYRAKSRGRVVADFDEPPETLSHKTMAQHQHRVVTDGDAYDSESIESYPPPTKSRGRVVADGDADDEYSEPTKPIATSYKAQSRGRVVTDNDDNTAGDNENTSRPDSPNALCTPSARVRRDGSSSEDSDSEGVEAGKTGKTGSGGDDPHSEHSDDDLPVHLSDPLDNFKHHQTLALRLQELQVQVDTMAVDVNQKSQDIIEGHVLIQNLQDEIATLKEAHDKQQSYITSVETELSQVKEQQLAARKPAVDKNTLSKVQALEKLVSDRDQYITRQKRELDELKKLMTTVKTSSDSNAATLLELQLKSRLSPSTRRPAAGMGATDVHYGNVISETRFIQLEHRVEDLARETSTTRAHVQELEIQLQAQVAATYNGSCLWRIPDVPKRRRDALEDRILSIYSPAFYTGRHGYKMCCRMYLNGDGMGLGTHISVFFVVMRGDYDALLKWPFEHKVSLILVDQTHRKHIVQTFKPTPDSSSFKRPSSDMNVASGCPQFASIDVLRDDKYVKDETMFIKCIVDTSKIFHP